MIGGKGSKPAWWGRLNDDIAEKWEKEAYSRGILFDEDRPDKGLYEQIRTGYGLDPSYRPNSLTYETIAKAIDELYHGEDIRRKRRLLLL